jgi:hypothetical protein
MISIDPSIFSAALAPGAINALMTSLRFLGDCQMRGDLRGPMEVRPVYGKPQRLYQHGGTVLVPFLVALEITVEWSKFEDTTMTMPLGGSDWKAFQDYKDMIASAVAREPEEDPA